jgi:hypothetical protein
MIASEDRGILSLVEADMHAYMMGEMTATCGDFIVSTFPKPCPGRDDG